MESETTIREGAVMLSKKKNETTQLKGRSVQLKDTTGKKFTMANLIRDEISIFAGYGQIVNVTLEDMVKAINMLNLGRTVQIVENEKEVA